MAKIAVLDPTSEASGEALRLPPRLDSVRGKSIGVRVHWTRFDAFAERVEELLRQRYGAARTPRIEGRAITMQPRRSSEWATWLAQSDAAIVGLAA